MTEWDAYYMRKPTRIDHLYPDPIGNIEKLEAYEMSKYVTWASRFLALFIVVCSGFALYNLFPEFQWAFKLFWFQG